MNLSARSNERAAIIQALIDTRNARTYLEIGVQYGDTFFWIKAKKKMAVDPLFLFNTTSKLKWLRWNRYNIFNEYYNMPSDAFFSQNARKLRKHRLEVVFVDGLHTYEQSLRDIENSLLFLHDNGVIILDDCNPPNEQVSCPIKPKNDDPWCGDVWKSIVHLRSHRCDLRIFVLDCVYGLGIITRAPAESLLSYSCDDIRAMSYADFASNRYSLLNMKQRSYFNEFIKEKTSLP